MSLLYHALVVLDHPLGVKSSVDKRPLVFGRAVHHRHRVVLKIMIKWYHENNHEQCSIILEFTQRMQKFAQMQKMFWPPFQLSIKDLLPPPSEYRWASSPRCRRILAPSFDHKAESRNNPYSRCLAPRTNLFNIITIGILGNIGMQISDMFLKMQVSTWNSEKAAVISSASTCLQWYNNRT